MKTLRLLNSSKLALVDDEDFDRISKFKWQLHQSRTGDVIVMNGSAYHQLANFIMNDYTLMFDHKNRDPYDNQKLNLRKCTHAENCRNQDKRTGEYTSKYKGVYYDRSYWRARITYNYKTIYLGYFRTEVEAARAYNNAAKQHFGEFACLNNL